MEILLTFWLYGKLKTYNMEIKFVNRGILQVIEPLNIKEEDIETVLIGESTFIVRLKDGRQFVRGYILDKLPTFQAMNWKETD